MQRRRALRLTTDIALAVTESVPVSGQKLAKLEPAAGCYLGALDDYAGHNDAAWAQNRRAHFTITAK